ncbi:MAG: dihydropteroate synthase [Pseudomonadota bacterium]
MGVLNVTPDSFSDGGELLRDDQPALDRVLERAQSMVAAGASILDIGGESSRPGAQPVTPAEELDRVLPVIEALRDLDCVLSIDSYRPAVAQAAVAAGAGLVNDITGGRDGTMLAAVAETTAAYCIMHMQGEPQSMQDAPHYDDVLAEVGTFLMDRHRAARAAGIEGDRLLIDPGFGFGKTLAHNVTLLAGMRALCELGPPVLVGLSRKRMLGELTGQPVTRRMPAGLAAAVLAVAGGARIVRTHDVAATADAVAVCAATGAGASGFEFRE